MADREEFYEFDCLRGIAMCLVFAIHAEGIVRWAYTVPPDTSFWWSFIYGGHTAPTLFFVLSAFLLSRPFLAELRGGRRVNIENYFARRALRIMPLYVVAVLVAIVCTSATTTQALHAWAKDQKIGGVGIYLKSGFVHMDTGPVRYWEGE